MFEIGIHYILIAYFVLLLISIYSPIFAMCLTLVGSYNPLYSFFILNLLGFEYAIIRIGILLGGMSVVVFSILLRKLLIKDYQRLSNKYDLWFLIILFFVLLSSLIGIIMNNPIIEVISGSLPFLEIIGFYFIANYILKNEENIRIFLRFFYVWLFITFIICIIQYIVFNPLYYAHIDVAGVSIARNNDFIVGIFWPMLLAFYIQKGNSYFSNKSTFFLLLLSSLVLLSTLTRSVWLGALVGSFFIIFQLSFMRKINLFVTFSFSFFIVIFLASIIQIENDISLLNALTDRFIQFRRIYRFN